MMKNSVNLLFLRHQAEKCQFSNSEEYPIDQITEKCKSKEIRRKILLLRNSKDTTTSLGILKMQVNVNCLISRLIKLQGETGKVNYWTTQ